VDIAKKGEGEGPPSWMLTVHKRGKQVAEIRSKLDLAVVLNIEL